MGLDKVKALIFDTFGTVVDWRGSVIADPEAYLGAEGPWDIVVDSFTGLADRLGV